MGYGYAPRGGAAPRRGRARETRRHEHSLIVVDTVAGTITIDGHPFPWRATPCTSGQTAAPDELVVGVPYLDVRIYAETIILSDAISLANLAAYADHVARRGT